jgi:glycosyltransferase involved in cell wall biosynthesis
MNILLSSLLEEDKLESQHFIRVLKRMGHNLFCFGMPSTRDEPQRGIRVTAGYAPDIRLESICKVAGFEPDLFLFIEPGLIPSGVEKAPFPTACVICDTHRALEVRRMTARFFDHVFLYHRNYLKYFDEHPAGHVHWMPFACDLEFYYPRLVERDLDIGFIGKLYVSAERQSLIAELSRRYKMNPDRYHYQKETAETYSRAKIVLNLPLADDLNFRTFEAMSCGSMLLTRRVSNGQEELFEEGKHYAAFSTEQEMFEKIDYYLAHAEERESIAAAGLAEVQQHHRLEQRLTNLLEIVQGGREGAAPVRNMLPQQLDGHYAWWYEYTRRPEAGLHLARQAREAHRPWLHLTAAVIRTSFRVLFR